jgi:branched-chain amino acid transport system substrate-binding protein
MKDFRVTVSVFILISLIIVSCEKKEETINIGAVLPLSGSIAQYGAYMKQGLEIALDDTYKEGVLSNENVQLIIEDGQGSPRESVNAFNKLITSNKIVACIPATSGVTLAMKPIANQKNIVLINGSAISNEIEDKNDFVFSVLPNAKIEGEFLATVSFDTLNMKSAVVVYRDDASGSSFKDSFVKKFQDLGGRILDIQGHQPNVVSFQSIITKISKVSADIIFVASWGPEVALFAKQSKELGLKKQIITYETFNSPKVLEIAGNSAEGVIFCSPQFNENSNDIRISELREKVLQKYNQVEVNYYIAAHYDAFMLIMSAIAEGNKKGDAIRSYLANLKLYEGITGTMRFDDKGACTMALELYTVKNNQFVRY